MVTCQPGYKKVVKEKKATKSQKYHSFITPMMAGTTKTKIGSGYAAVKTGYKGGIFMQFSLYYYLIQPSNTKCDQQLKKK